MGSQACAMYLEFGLQANCVVSDNIGGREATYDVCGATHKSGKTLTATLHTTIPGSERGSEEC